MAPDLTESDHEQFAALREKLAGVQRRTPDDPATFTEFAPIDPMLAETFDGDLTEFDEEDWIAEQKFDGTRIILEKLDGEVQLYTRRHVERSETLETVTAAAKESLPDGLVLDGEITFLDGERSSVFVPIHARSDIQKQQLDTVYFVFDILVEDGKWITRLPLSDRKQRVRSNVPEGELIRPVEFETSDFASYYDDLVAADEEGIIIKRWTSPYHTGTRSRHWQKVKAFNETDLLAVGYTPGEGQRSNTFGALVMSDGERYRGRVGSGFTEDTLDALLASMVKVEERPYSPDLVGMSYTPVEPFVIEVKYQEITDSGDLRAPVFLRTRPDKPIADVEPLDR